MSLLLDAAIAWKRMLDKSYLITIGHRNVERNIYLAFEPVDFDHLSGIQHADDIDFKLPRRKYRGDKLMDAVISGKLDASQIEKSVNWNLIEDRLLALIQIEQILDSPFVIYEFANYKLRFHTPIRAAYCIYNESIQCGVFLFIDKEGQRYFGKSILGKSIYDFTQNQTSWTILKKIKVVAGKEIELFRHKAYNEHRNNC